MITNIVTEVFNCNIYAYYLSTNRVTLVVYIAQPVYILHLCKYIAICSIDDIGDNLDRFDFFFLRLTVYQVLKFVFLHCHENSYLLFQFPFQLNFIYIFSFHLTMITKPPREPHGYQRYRTSGRGTTANQMKKEKTTSISKHALLITTPQKWHS